MRITSIIIDHHRIKELVEASIGALLILRDQNFSSFINSLSKYFSIPSLNTLKGIVEPYEKDLADEI
jgi:hypothetical protein